MRSLGAEDGAFFRTAYDVTPEGNWEHHTILHRNRAPALLSDAEEQRLAGLRAKLKAVRDKRVWPGWDDKVLADWNGLMIAALANAAGRVPARRLAGRRDARLALRHGHDARRATAGCSIPTAPASACIAARSTTTPTWRAPASPCSRSTGETRYLDEAQALIAVLDRHFADPTGGGYFITADDAADLIVRGKHCHDNAVPAGNGTLVGVFARLWVLTGEARWHDKAGRQVAAFAGELDRQLLPADDAAQRLRDAAERRRAGDRRRSDGARDRGAAPRGLRQEPAQQDRAPARARHAAARRTIRPPAKVSWTASPRSTSAAT